MSLNRVSLMGRITADLELKHTPSNYAVTSFQIAIDRNFVKQGEERKTDFITIVAWKNTAEFVCKYFKKGNFIAVDGSIQTRSYTDKNKNNRTAFEVLADNVFFCEKKESPLSNLENAAKASGVDVSHGQDDFTQVLSEDDLPF